MMGQITIERYDKDSEYLCIRMRFKKLDGQGVVATFTNNAWVEGEFPGGTMLWHPDHLEAATEAYWLIMQESKKIGAGT